MRTILTNLSDAIPFVAGTSQYARTYTTDPQKEFYAFWNPNGSFDPVTMNKVEAGQRLFIHNIRFSVLGMDLVRDYRNLISPQYVGNGDAYITPAQSASGAAVGPGLGFVNFRWSEWLRVEHLLTLTDNVNDYLLRIDIAPGGGYTPFSFDPLNVQAVYVGQPMQYRVEVDASIPGVFKS